ncbi:MAG: AAA family ATPase [Deinococcales bacterium]
MDQRKVITLAFFNNKGGVGKTTLVYHLAWMFAELGHRIIMADLDPQANLSSLALPEESLYDLISSEKSTILQAIRPLIKGIGDIDQAPLKSLLNEHELYGSLFNDEPQLYLIPGHLELSAYEDRLSDSWTKCLNRDESAFRHVSAFYRIIQQVAQDYRANICLIDVGPNLGAINRCALIAADAVIIPVAADLFSVIGMRNLGIRLKEWREQWQQRYHHRPADPSLNLPKQAMAPLGYIVSQHGIKEKRPVKSYLNWANEFPKTYREFVDPQLEGAIPASVEEDSACLGLLKHYHSLAPMAMEAHKPIFLLKPADGAIGAHYQAVERAYRDFKDLAEKLLQVSGIVEKADTLG